MALITDYIHVDNVGKATLSSGTVTVSTTHVSTDSMVFLTVAPTGTSVGKLRVSAVVADTSFTITSSDSGDDCEVWWFIIDHNPA